MEEYVRAAIAAQAGMVSRRQLSAWGIDRFHVRNQVRARRWVERTSMVVSTTTGPLSRAQLMWLGVLHAGPGAVIGGLTAGEVAGLRRWHRDEVTVLVPDELEFDDAAGVQYVRTRRDLTIMRHPGSRLPLCRVEPALLLFAGYQPSRRTAQGVVAAAVQQRISTPEQLIFWVDAMRPLRWAGLFRQVIGDIAGGSTSGAELDVLRMCRTFGLVRPDRQVPRLDAEGRRRFTDCEWRLANGLTVVLEVDGAFHMEVEHWEDDLARQRRLSGPGRIVVRCTSRELRDEPHRVADDLRALGVPSRAPQRAR
jgi:hypothetical protein